MKKWMPLVVLLVVSFCAPAQLLADDINLWSFGTPIAETDGNITFYQSWSTPPDFKLHDITYTSDGIAVKGWVLEPKTSGPHPVLIWNRGGFGGAGITWGSSSNPTLYREELFAYASAGYAVVCTQYRGNGYIVPDSVSPADVKSGIDNFDPNTGKDAFGGAEVNDVINLLPLVEKLNSAGGNGGLTMNLDLNRVAMMGMSRGGMETYIAVRELSDEVKYGSLPEIKAAIVKGAISHFPGFMSDRYLGITPAWPSGGNEANRLFASYIANGGVISPEIAAFFPDGSFPVWNDADLLHDEWLESNLSDPPSSLYGLVYSEEYYARSAALWKEFWASNTIPFLILHGMGDTQVLWEDAQQIYDNILAYGGDPSLYTLMLYADSLEDTAATAFLGTDLAKLQHTDHWLINYDYGHGATLPWLAQQVNAVPEPATMLLLGGGLVGLAGFRNRFRGKVRCSPRRKDTTNEARGGNTPC